MKNAILLVVALSCAWCPGGERPVASDGGAWGKDANAILCDFFKKLDRHVTADFKDTPMDEVITFLNALTKVGISIGGEDAASLLNRKITAAFTDVPASVIFERLCKESKADWTIAPVGNAVKVQFGTPEKIAELEKKYPRFAEKVRNYRRAPAAVDGCLARLGMSASMELEDTPLSDALMFVLNGIGKINNIPAGDPRNVKDVKISVKLTDKPLGVILDQVCKAGGADWTVAPQDPGGWVYLIHGTPKQVAEIEKKYPDFAKKVREFREKSSEKK